jgi:hypothetical protein
MIGIHAIHATPGWPAPTLEDQHRASLLYFIEPEVLNGGRASWDIAQELAANIHQTESETAYFGRLNTLFDALGHAPRPTDWTFASDCLAATFPDAESFLTVALSATTAGYDTFFIHRDRPGTGYYLEVYL